MESWFLFDVRRFWNYMRSVSSLRPICLVENGKRKQEGKQKQEN